MLYRRESHVKISQTDLEHILDHTRDLWQEVRGQRLFITGGTGFFGCWLLESFAWANDRLGLNAHALILTRNTEAFKRKAPHLADHPAIAFWPGDIRSFDLPSGTYSYIIHAATDADKQLNDNEPIRMFETITTGAQRVMDFARQCCAVKLLLTSSGAVYGPQPPGLDRIPEDYRGAVDPTQPGVAYHEGKRCSEFLFTTSARQQGFEAKIARCFAFVGPHLPLEKHFAIGNFIRDGLLGGPIQVNGDGTPYRSYLYAADLAIWLWTILFRGRNCIPYNVGSDQALTISEAAGIVAQSFRPPVGVRIAKAASILPPERYVPDVRRAHEELGLRVFIDLPEAVLRTIAWYRNKTL